MTLGRALPVVSLHAGNGQRSARQEPYTSSSATLSIHGVEYPSVDAEHFVDDSDIGDIARSVVFACLICLPGSDAYACAVFCQHRIGVEGRLSGEDIVALAPRHPSLASRVILEGGSQESLALCSDGNHVAPGQRLRTAADHLLSSIPLNAVEQSVVMSTKRLRSAASCKKWSTEADPPNFLKAIETLFEYYISLSLHLNKRICPCSTSSK
ncbi:uncharacterized protein PHACADRAFT_197464 [Phanerochaete carnosa HHB-10118-sp]|uniref:Uncharacterized protein n=1 Tax=Phanerochaete carnosa (strain HHB-10118-sp) TaxID=650164 RepID=K5W2A8_PHACS|nr:uncharacterized protein PHACADRAFT_197464 [Phanerochaete carnosa HHB-10118-sp]EKM53034.1 hypothetical protein PHACADRAFT_197464 [Phanerochaete carnosa HHB-10118-sp]